MNTTSLAGPGRDGRWNRLRPGPGRRLATSGLAVVLASSLYACAAAGADEHVTADGTAAAEAAETTASPPEEASTAEDAQVAETPAEASRDVEAPGNTRAEPPAAMPASPRAQEGARAAQEQPSQEQRPEVVSPPRGGDPAVIRGTGTGEEQRSTRSAVALNEIARPADGIEIRVRELRAVQSRGEAPGYRYGPAVVLVITVHNRTDAPISTLASDVTVEYGQDRRPADPSPQAEDSLLPAEIAAGRTATGTYTFLIPEEVRDDLSVTVSYRSTDPAVVLEGPARLIGQNR